MLIYAHDPRDPVKQNKAGTLIASLTDGVLLWQVACGYVAASRKLAAFGLRSAKGFRQPATFAECVAASLPNLGDV